ncbi:MAG: UDP-N-acetylmuramoyl-L-alanyl-D-glutamate--2,6-diaminopimelate ligase [Pseudomonadota bacterium]
MRSLANLLKTALNIEINQDRLISGLCLDSRQARKGDVFFAFQGYRQDGKQFIAEAIEKGAVAILVDKPLTVLPDPSPPVIVIDNLVEKIGLIATIFYQQPSKELTVIGVTGTDGKTSVCYLLAQALYQLGYCTGLMGTIGNGKWPNLNQTHRTTIDAIRLHQQLADLVEQKVSIVVIEVSSHALKQGRVAGVQFDYAVFTNLSREHLDYHNDMADYAASKKRLLEWPRLRASIINAADSTGATWIKSFKHRSSLWTYSPDASIKADVCADNIVADQHGIQAEIKTKTGEGILRSVLLGRFNIDNLLAVISVLLMMKISLDQILSVMSTLQTVPGRMETIGGKHRPLVVIDYAHTVKALTAVLSTLKKITRGKLICVFGCGGNRDRGKRPLMARAAEQYAEAMIITNDNPRDENPNNIINEIIAGFSSKAIFQIEPDRKKAIQLGVSLAKENDIVLIAGKGHENYQEIAGKKIAFSDLEVARDFLK